MGDYGFAESLMDGVVIGLGIGALAFIYLTVRGITAAGAPITLGHALVLVSMLIFLAVIAGITMFGMFSGIEP